jgi:hypothetical protein
MSICRPADLQPYIDWLTNQPKDIRQHVVGANVFDISSSEVPALYFGTLRYVPVPGTDTQYLSAILISQDGSAVRPPLYIGIHPRANEVHCDFVLPDHVVFETQIECSVVNGDLVLLVRTGTGETVVIELAKLTTFRDQTFVPPAVQGQLQRALNPQPLPPIAEDNVRPLWTQLMTQLHIPNGPGHGPINFPPAIDDIMAALHIHTISYLMLDQQAAQRIRNATEETLVHTIRNLSKLHESSQKGAAAA